MTFLEAAIANMDAYNAVYSSTGARDPAREAELVASVTDAMCDAITEAMEATPIPLNAEGQRIVLEALGVDPDAPRIPEGEVVTLPVTEEDVRLCRMRWEVRRPAKEFTIDIELGREDG